MTNEKMLSLVWRSSQDDCICLHKSFFFLLIINLILLLALIIFTTNKRRGKERLIEKLHMSRMAMLSLIMKLIWDPVSFDIRSRVSPFSIKVWQRRLHRYFFRSRIFHSQNKKRNVDHNDSRQSISHCLNKLIGCCHGARQTNSSQFGF